MKQQPINHDGMGCGVGGGVCLECLGEHGGGTVSAISERPLGAHIGFGERQEQRPPGIDRTIWNQVCRNLRESARNAYRGRYDYGWYAWWQAGEEEAREFVRVLRVVRAMNITPRIPEDHRVP